MEINEAHSAASGDEVVVVVGVPYLDVVFSLDVLVARVLDVHTLEVLGVEPEVLFVVVDVILYLFDVVVLMLSIVAAAGTAIHI